ncbi:MAG: YraN family protein [Caldimonas sp.]
MTSDARTAAPRTTKSRGDEAERRALAHLVANGLVPVERNYRVARGPRARGGEVDLILRDRDGTLVFVEVRARADARHGGAAATVGFLKQQRLIFAARHFLARFAALPPCRFDVVTVEGERIVWLRAAFDAS